MATLMPSHGDIEQGIPTPHRCSAATAAVDSGEESSLSESEVVAAEVNAEGTRRSTSSSCVSECSVEEEVVDLESGGGCGGGDGGVAAVTKAGAHSEKVKRDCRICHLSLDGSNPESGFPIELGCSCKEDLAAAHKQCAEAWFKIRGNKTCEICGSTARNVVGVNEVELMDQWNEGNETAATTAPMPQPAETRHFWQGHRFLNFLLACMVFAFVISWLFHFNVPS